jgi:hypothetical protein
MPRYGLIVGLLAAALLTSACAAAVSVPGVHVEGSSVMPASTSPEYTGEPGHYEFPENPKGPGIPPARIH